MYCATVCTFLATAKMSPDHGRATMANSMPQPINTGVRVGPKSGLSTFTLIAPVRWPYVALRCNITLDKSEAHRMICEIMEAADEHNLVEYIDEIVNDGVLYVTLTMSFETVENPDLRQTALAIVNTIVAKTRKHAQNEQIDASVQKRSKAMQAHPAGWVSRGKGQ